MSSHLRTMFSSAGSPFSSQPSSRAHSPDPSHHHHAPSDLGETDHHDSQRDILDADVPFELIPEGSRRKRIVVAITGATGTTIAIRLLQALKALDIETHLVMSKWAVNTLKYETDHTASEIKALADYHYAYGDLAAAPSSGSFIHDGMIIVPCSMKTLAAIRIGFGEDLIARSADVCLKEGRKLMMVVRETPLSEIHLENMLFLRRAGAVIFPPVPAYYIRPESIDDLTNQTVGRILDSMGIHTTGFQRWSGSHRQ